MVRKWGVFFNDFKSVLKQSRRFIFIAVLGVILTVGLHEMPRGLASNVLGLQKRDIALAQTLNKQGQHLWEMGNAEAALKHWEEAEAIYQENGSREGAIGSRINQSHAWEAMGHHRQACDRLLQTFVPDKKCGDLNQNNLSEVLESFPNINEDLTFIGMQTLGKALRKVGKLDESWKVLEDSLKKARSPEDKSKALLSLGNTARSLVNKHEDLQNDADFVFWIQKAFKHHQDAINTGGSLTTLIPAKLNYINLIIKSPNSSNLSRRKSIDGLIKEVKADINKLPLSQLAVDARIHLACSFLGCDRPTVPVPTNLKSELSNSEIEQLLAKAINYAERLQNPRLKSLALGTLGRFYENSGNQLQAERMTREALNLALANNALNLAYQWQWQMGRILKKREEVEEAINYYRQSVKTLNYLRRDLSIINDVEFSFRSQVEPVYQELASLLIDNRSKTSNLKEVVEVMDSLRLAELEFFLNCNLLDREEEEDTETSQAKSFEEVLAEVQQVDENAALIYPILLEDRLELLFKLPQQETWERRPSKLSKQELEVTIKKLRQYLCTPIYTTQVQQEGQKLYDWLIKPLEPELEKLKNRDPFPTLVFGLDDELQSIPLGVLYNRKQYLIENYSIAVIPSLQLFNSEHRGQRLRVLTAGVQKPQEVEGRSFKELQYVQQELTEIRKETKSPLSPLLNQTFTDKELKQLISSAGFPIIHIATHGRFSSNPEETFILAWGQLIKAKDFEEILQTINLDRKNALELLVLSACETAQGNPRAALGLAGIAAQARVRSTLATLWQVDDQATSDIMVEFYRQLGDEKTIAESLREAQLALLDKNTTSPPYFWAAYILVGNWL